MSQGFSYKSKHDKIVPNCDGAERQVPRSLKGMGLRKSFRSKPEPDQTIARAMGYRATSPENITIGTSGWHLEFAARRPRVKQVDKVRASAYGKQTDR
jgi:hypothetical protein